MHIAAAKFSCKPKHLLPLMGYKDRFPHEALFFASIGAPFRLHCDVEYTFCQLDYRRMVSEVTEFN